MPLSILHLLCSSSKGPLPTWEVRTLAQPGTQGHSAGPMTPCLLQPAGHCGPTPPPAVHENMTQVPANLTLFCPTLASQCNQNQPSFPYWDLQELSHCLVPSPGTTWQLHTLHLQNWELLALSSLRSSPQRISPKYPVNADQPPQDSLLHSSASSFSEHTEHPEVSFCLVHKDEGRHLSSPPEHSSRIPQEPASCLAPK